MTINQRALVDGAMVDVVCTGRFYDYFARRVVDGAPAWRIVRRQPIHEKDRIDPLDPDMPGLQGPVVEALYARGDKWLAGDPSAFGEPPVESGI